MKDQATKVLENMKQFWASQEKKRRNLMIIALVVLILLAVVTTVLLNQKNYTVLYTNLDTTEASEIVSKIQSMNIDVQLKSDGTVVVDEESADQLRMQLALEGYPKSGYSDDFYLNNVDLFTTDSQQREIVKLSLQKKLEATVETFSGVREAVVTLDIPVKANTVIQPNQTGATASVVVHLEDGVTLKSNQISGIRQLIKTSISGLEDKNISLIDGNGDLLISSKNDDDISIEQDRLYFKSAFEDQLANEVRNLLAPSYGLGGVNVAVNATFNYDKEVTDDTIYTPSVGENGMVEHEDHEDSETTTTNPNGEVGADPNADGTYPTLDKGGNVITWSENKDSTSYLVNTLKKQTEKNGATCEKVSVSVMVYTNAISDADKRTIIEGVANATGTTIELVSVGNLPLLDDKPPVIIPGDEIVFGYNLEELIIIATIIAICLLAIIIIAIVISLRIKKAKKEKKRIELLAAQEEQRKALEIQKISEATAEETKESAIRREISGFAESNPEIIAQLLRSWLREEGDF